MKHLIVVAIAVFISMTNVHAQSKRHVVLISVDGLRPEMYRDTSWPAPNLQQLSRRGTYALYMTSVFPSYTYPSHTAMLTGAMPARSGIYFNQPKNSKGEWSWMADSVKVPTLWKRLKDLDMTTAAVEWPVSVHAPITWNIPEIWSDQYPDRITESRKYATPGLIEEIEKHATGILDQANMSEESFTMDANSARMAGYIFTTYRPNLLAVHFAEVDGMEHEYGRDGDSVRLAVAAVDRAIGDILEAIHRSGMEDSTTVLVVGDHGFATISKVFRPNMLIADLPVRFIAAGGSAFLYAKSSVLAPNVITTVVDRFNHLPAAQRKLFRLLHRPALDKMGVDSSALLALAATPGIVFSGSLAPGTPVNNGPGTFIQQSSLKGLWVTTSGGHHGYDPHHPQMYTGFIAAGAGVQKGKQIKTLCVTDVAPVIARLLGISFTTPDGKVPDSLLK